MTIKEQLEDSIEQCIYNSMDATIYGTDNAASKCESIVEDIAIQFVEWIEKNAFCTFGSWSFHKDNSSYFKKIQLGLKPKSPKRYNTKELFEMFKKENNL